MGHLVKIDDIWTLWTAFVKTRCPSNCREQGDWRNQISKRKTSTHARKAESIKREKWSGHRDLNSGPLVPQTSALPSCAMARHKGKAGKLGELWIRFQMLFSESWIYLSWTPQTVEFNLLPIELKGIQLYPFS